MPELDGGETLIDWDGNQISEEIEEPREFVP